MARFNAGDRVVANKSIVATVLVYDEETGRLALEQVLPGGSTNTIYGPIQSYDLELLVSDAVTETPAEEPPATPAVETPAVTDQFAAVTDQFTTLDTLS